MTPPADNRNQAQTAANWKQSGRGSRESSLAPWESIFPPQNVSKCPTKYDQLKFSYNMSDMSSVMR